VYLIEHGAYDGGLDFAGTLESVTDFWKIYFV